MFQVFHLVELFGLQSVLCRSFLSAPDCFLTLHLLQLLVQSAHRLFIYHALGSKLQKTSTSVKRLKDKMSPLSSLVHLRNIKSSLLWCADLYLVHLLQSGIFYWGNKKHFLQEEILFFVSCDHFLQDKMFLSRHFTQDFSLMGEKQKIVSPHMIKNIVCWKKIQNTKYFSQGKN